MRKKTRKHCVEKAKEVAKARDKYTCKRCGRSGTVQIQGSHIKGEGAYPNLSYIPRNIMAKCAECHRWWHSVPSESGIWFKETFPEWYEEIAKMAREPVGKHDYNVIYDELCEELNQYE